MAMRRVALESVEPGMSLARAIHNARGQQLLAAGAELTPQVVEALHRIGLESVYASDALSHDIEIGEAVSERTRSVLAAKLSAIDELLLAASASFRGSDPDRIRDGMASPLFLDALERTTLFDELREEAAKLAHDVMLRPGLVRVAESLSAHQSHDDTAHGLTVDRAAVAIFLGRLARLGRVELERVAFGVLLANVGQLFLDTTALAEPRPLSAGEREVLETHPEWGYQLARTLELDPITSHIIYQHHERQDGYGYPRGLTGLNRVYRTPNEALDGRYILLSAEIAAVAEVHASLLIARPYRPAMPTAQALATLQQMAGNQLNAELVEKLLSVTPPFPSGSDVVLTGGGFERHRALVVRVPEGGVTRPIVRVYEDGARKPFGPRDVALAEQPAIQIVAAAA